MNEYACPYFYPPAQKTTGLPVGLHEKTMKKFDIKVIPGAKRSQWKEENGQIKVYLTAPPVDGKANKALIGFLARHFAVKKHEVNIIKGLKARYKTVSINNS